MNTSIFYKPMSGNLLLKFTQNVVEPISLTKSFLHRKRMVLLTSFRNARRFLPQSDKTEHDIQSANLFCSTLVCGWHSSARQMHSSTNKGSQRWLTYHNWVQWNIEWLLKDRLWSHQCFNINWGIDQFVVFSKWITFLRL